MIGHFAKTVSDLKLLSIFAKTASQVFGRFANTSLELLFARTSTCNCKSRSLLNSYIVQVQCFALLQGKTEHKFFQFFFFFFLFFILR